MLFGGGAFCYWGFFVLFWVFVHFLRVFDWFVVGCYVCFGIALVLFCGFWLIWGFICLGFCWFFCFVFVFFVSLFVFVLVFFWLFFNTSRSFCCPSGKGQLNLMKFPFLLQSYLILPSNLNSESKLSNLVKTKKYQMLLFPKSIKEERC